MDNYPIEVILFLDKILYIDFNFGSQQVGFFWGSTIKFLKFTIIGKAKGITNVTDSELI
jgi:hypothetical protein